jgi:hypothetical protein
MLRKSLPELSETDKYGCGRTKTTAIIHELARNDDENMTALLKQSTYSVGEISHKKMGLCSLHSRCLERPTPHVSLI